MKQRLKQFENFRHNLRMLRAFHRTRSKELAAELNLISLRRLTELELGRIGRPYESEVEAICKYYNVSREKMMNKRIKIVFE